MIYIVIPVFNELRRWNHEYFLQVSRLKNVRLLFVDDGSTDGSLNLISKLIQSNPSIEVLSLEKNMGKAEAVRLGLRNVLTKPKVRTVGFLDSDGAFSLDDIHRITDIASNQHEVANSAWWWSSRIKLAGSRIKRSKIRHSIGRVVATLLYTKNYSLPYDTQAGFKLFRLDNFFKQTLDEPFLTKWFVDLELLYRYRSFSGHFPNIEEVPLTTWTEIPNSKLGIKNALEVIQELLFIRALQKRS